MGWCLECHRRTNYVGGPGYDAKDPATFAVGTANYDVQRLRIKPDAVADFVERRTKAATDGAPADAHAGHDHDESANDEPTERPFGSHGAMPESQLRAMSELVAAYPQLKDLPAWRLADLPVSHRAIYGEMIADEVAKAKSDRSYPEGAAEREQFELRLLQRLSFMNSPTQCSTCHQ
jgi:pyocin large subunit-like protein